MWVESLDTGRKEVKINQGAKYALKSKTPTVKIVQWFRFTICRCINIGLQNNIRTLHFLIQGWGKKIIVVSLSNPEDKTLRSASISVFWRCKASNLDTHLMNSSTSHFID